MTRNENLCGSRGRVSFVYGDILKRDTIREALESVKGNIDAVFHLAAAIGDRGETDEVIWKSNVEGTRNVVSECFRRKTGKFVHFSSFSVYGYTDHIVNEESPYTTFTTLYGKSKRKSEEIVNNYKKA